MNRRRRVAVTGLGAVTALGPTCAETWQAVCAGECAIGPMDLFDPSDFRTQTAAQVRRMPRTGLPEGRALRRASRADRFALAAAQEALADAALPDGDRAGATIVFGAGAGGMLEAEAYHRAWLRGDWRHARLADLTTHPPCETTDFVASHLGLLGPRTTITTACSSSTTGIGHAADQIRAGRATVALAGGAEALCRLTYAGFNALRAVDPGRTRPFDARRAGLSLGEGAGMLVLEDWDRAVARGARIRGEVLGYATSGDAHHMTAPHPEGSGAALAMRGALEDAEIGAEAVDYVNAHGTGTVQNDGAETKAIHAVLGARAPHVPVSSTKSQLGHCLGAAGAIEAVVTCLALEDGVLPPTAGWQQRDPDCDLDYVPDPGRRVRLSVALSNSFAFGGNNAVLALGRADRTR